MTVLLLYADRILCAHSPDAADSLAHATATGIRVSEVPVEHASSATPDALAEALRSLRSRKDDSRIRPGESIVILSENVFTQTLHLPARQLAGLSAAELEQALAYEAAPFSGYVSDDALTAFRRGETIDGETTFSIAQFSKSGMAGFVRAIAAARCICSGIGGIPADDANDPAKLAAAAAAGLFPLLRPHVGVSAWRTPACFGGALLLIALLAAIVYGARLSSAVRSTDARLLKARELVRENRALETALANRRASPQDAIGSGAAALQAFRHSAWKTLLALFDQVFSNCGKIQNIEEIGPYDVRVTALFADAAAYESGAAILLEQTAKTGWTVTPEHAENLRIAGEQSPWRFVFRAQGPDSVRKIFPATASDSSEVEFN
ncbi:MAG: hypothetical protein ACI4QT_03985 [Kiritimatiellia bacterium]